MRRLLLCGLLVAAPLEAGPRSRAIDKIIAAHRKPNAPGCAVGVRQRGKVIYAGAFGLADIVHHAPLTPQTPVYVASLAKQFTAAAIHLLVMDARLRLDESIRHYFPELPDYAGKVRVADLMYHTSGLRDVGPLLEIVGRRDSDLNTAEILELLAAQSAPNFPAGTDYEYTNTEYVLLAEIVARAGGLPLPQFQFEYLFKRLGMQKNQARKAIGYEADGGKFRPAAPPPSRTGDGGLHLSVSDLLHWGRNFESPRVGGKLLVTRMQAPGSLRSGQLVPYASGLVPSEYGGRPTIGHDGQYPGYSAQFVRFPRQRLSIVCLCNRSDIDSGTLALQLANVYLGRGVSNAAASRATWPQGRLSQVAGVWESEQGFLMRVSVAANSITVDQFESKWQLHPMNGSQLRSADQVPLVMTIRDPDRVDLGWQGGLPDRYHRLQTQMPSPEQMRAYAGEYWSGDVQARWSIAAEGNGLAIKTAAGWHIPLETLGSDRFAVGPWSLQFTRNPDGHITRLVLHRRRLWNLVFERQYPTGPPL